MCSSQGYIVFRKFWCERLDHGCFCFPFVYSYFPTITIYYLYNLYTVDSTALFREKEEFLVKYGRLSFSLHCDFSKPRLAILHKQQSLVCFSHYFILTSFHHIYINLEH